MTLRFAILHHSGICDPHFDMLFETSPGSSLACWRSPAWPIAAPTPIARIQDHRRVYLDYEGPLSGNRGRVRRAAQGTFEPIEQSEARWVLQLQGGLLLTLLRNDEGWTASAG